MPLVVPGIAERSSAIQKPEDETEHHPFNLEQVVKYFDMTSSDSLNWEIFCSVLCQKKASIHIKGFGIVRFIPKPFILPPFICKLNLIDE